MTSESELERLQQRIVEIDAEIKGWQEQYELEAAALAEAGKKRVSPLLKERLSVSEALNGELLKLHGLEIGDSLAITREFLDRLRERGWGNHKVLLFARAKVARIEHYDGSARVIVRALNQGTGDVDIALAQRMKQVFQERKETQGDSND
jgi:hypothetical protein